MTTPKTNNPFQNLLQRSTSSKLPMYRHGDVMIAQISELPTDLKERGGTILARGEITGHSHRIQEHGVTKLWERGEDMFLEVLADSVTVVHEEHRPIPLLKGFYRVWMQREYHPDAIRRVVD
jgi:hypothetical protein